MKQLLFLLLFPCLALAQYPSNGNQKISLGEQTTADGLVYRGVASIDTVTATSKITRANKQDTSAYLLLDTVTNLLWHYKIGSNAWTQAGGGVSVTSFSAGTTGLTPSTATTGAVTLGGTLAVTNGGTGQSTLTANKVMVGNGISGVLMPTNLHWDNTNSRLGINTTSPLAKLHLTGGGISSSISDVDSNSTFRFDLANPAISLSIGYANPVDVPYIQGSNNGLESGIAILINPYGGSLGIGLNGNPTQAIHVVGNARITAVGTASSNNAALYVTDEGVLSTNISDVNKKHNIRNLPYGLSTINNLNPVAFEWNETDETDIGFIAQDIENVIPESVITNWDSELIFRQEKIIPVLVKAIQEQNQQIKALEQRILILENK